MWLKNSVACFVQADDNSTSWNILHSVDILVVKSKKKRKTKICRENRQPGCELLVEYVHIDADSLSTKINKVKTVLGEADILSDIFQKVTSHFKTFDHLICYGLGSFSDSSISLHQFACLLHLKDKFGAKTLAYDPVFTPCDKDCLLSHGIEVVEKNDEGKTVIPLRGNTLVYFPHVPSQLVNNFLWANWSTSLRNCVIISNSFSSVIDRNQPETLKFIRKIQSICEELPIENSYSSSCIFNDLSVHSFTEVDKLDPSFWDGAVEPNYEGSVVEYFEKDLIILMRKL